MDNFTLAIPEPRERTEQERIMAFRELLGWWDPLLGRTDFIEQLLSLGYFSAPAAATHHSNYVGGLFDHSLEVTCKLLEMTSQFELFWEKTRSPVIVGMLHDLCKMDAYEVLVSPIPEEEAHIVHKDQIMPDHGARSVIIAQQLIGPLTGEEIACIRWHMGAFDSQENWGYYSRACKKYPNVLWTHTADMYASNVLGV